MANAATPTNLKETPISPTSIKLTWVDNESSEGGYKIEQSTYSSSWGAWSTIEASLSANTQEYNVTGLTPNSLHRFRVTALAAAIGEPTGNSTPVQTQGIYTYPDSAGIYYGYTDQAVASEGNKWTHILYIFGVSPYFDIISVHLASTRAQKEDIKNLRFGPLASTFNDSFITDLT